MKRTVISLLLMIGSCTLAFAQDRELARAARNGPQLPTRISVRDNVSAQAVLIPHGDARRIFGKEIAERYAVIEINVGNKSPDAALIIQGIFIDYSRWALSGTPLSSTTSSAEGLPQTRFEPFQSATNPTQVASEEYRVVRGQLLDAQMFSRRNVTMRLLTFAGNLVGAAHFPFSERGVLSSFNVFTGVFVPGMRDVWPDRTVEQLNRVSDFGYQANKVIPRQGAEIIVCFFPIERFLTPGFKKLYLKSPALFFAPLQMLVDKRIEKHVQSALDLGALDFSAMRQNLSCYLSIAQEQRGEKAADYNICLEEFGLTPVKEDGLTVLRVKNDATSRDRARIFRAMNFLNQVSLNNVRIVIDGVMSVETSAVAAQIDRISFDEVADCGNDGVPCFWADTAAGNGIRTGSVEGIYMPGGSVVIDEAGKLGITELKTISENVDDRTLRFSFKLTKPIAPETKLHFRVTKPAPSAPGKLLESNVREYLIHHPAPAAPEVQQVKQDTPEKGKLTIKGKGFLDSPTYPLKVKFIQPDGTGKDAKVLQKTSTELVIEVPAAPSGCWRGTISLGDAISATQTEENCFCFFVKPSPKLESALRQKDTMRIVVKGSDLIQTGLCGGPRMTLKLVNAAGVSRPLTGGTMDPLGSGGVLALPADAKDGSWTLKVLLDNAEVASIALTDTVP